MINIHDIRHRVSRRPMKTTFATSLGAKTTATSVLVEVELTDGTTVHGEVPTSFVLPHETVPAIKAVLNSARVLLPHKPIESYPELLQQLRRDHGMFHMTLAGLEVALFRAHQASMGRSEWGHWGGRLGQIETDITIPFVPDVQNLTCWLAKIPMAFDVFKVKVSGDIPADIAFLKTIDSALRRRLPRFTIRLDGNQGFTAGSYGKMVTRLERAGLDYELFEQPLRRDDYAGMRKIRRMGPRPVILDETIFCADDCRRVIDEDLGDGVNIKVAKSGIAQSAAILKLARKAKLKLMIGCMTETMVGLSAGIYIAAGSGAFDYIDLDSVHLLHHRPCEQGIGISGCTYTLETSNV